MTDKESAMRWWHNLYEKYKERYTALYFPKKKWWELSNNTVTDIWKTEH